jgi:hypothetical protein
MAQKASARIEGIANHITKVYEKERGEEERKRGREEERKRGREEERRRGRDE